MPAAFMPLPLPLPLPSSDRKLRFALVGCGRIASNHFAALRQHAQRAEWVGVCDTQPAALAAAVEATGAPGFTSLDRLLAGCNADAVVLATPSGLHPRQAAEVALAGRTSSAKNRWRPSGTKALRWCVPAATPA